MEALSSNSPSMEDFTHWVRTIVVESSEIQTQPISSPEFDINLTFSFQTYDYNWIIRQDSRDYHLHNLTISPITQKLISLNRQQFSNYSETCQILFQLLQYWPVLDSTRRISADFIWRRTNIGHQPNTGVNLHFHLATHNTNVLDEDEEEEVATCGMVPASQSSIESLEKRIIEHGRSCSICMDDLCEGFSMPCLHVFHGHCIKKWLMINHNCPLCRLEMPTTDDNADLYLPTCS
ncbi:hypothetical protein C2S53_007723 [Perilla frutescens var. hirtella]|uniref:RING-type E3 ubiquitin transferase n=1 Tax=Perilla frutescens var. hirtella TaxID=608512 RepID=A0AAD4IWG0_PERFH|nr:hypothetical protein C2S53_007723 [Perilla frutescens var. hirtella]